MGPCFSPIEYDTTYDNYLKKQNEKNHKNKMEGLHHNE